MVGTKLPLTQCELAQIQRWELLTLPINEIAARFDCSAAEVDEYVKAIRAELQKSAAPRLEPDAVSPVPFSTGDSGMDEVLGGGVYSRTLTEISGESGVGKTAFCVQLALAMSAKGTPAVYISTEGWACMRRMAQLLPRFPQASLDNVLFRECSSRQAFVHMLEHDLPRLLQRVQCRLVVIDSIAILSGQFNEKHHDSAEGCVGKRRTLVNRSVVCGQLRKLAHLHNLAVIVSNQGRNTPTISLKPTERNNVLYLENQGRWFTGWTEEIVEINHPDNVSISRPHALTPALGYAWTSNIDQRMVLKRKGRRVQLCVVFSPFTESTCAFVEMRPLGLYLEG